MRKLIVVALIAISGCTKYNVTQYQETLEACLEFQSKLPNKPSKVGVGEITFTQLNDCERSAKNSADMGSY